PDGVLLRRHFPSLVDLALQILDLDGDAEARIGLDPNFRIRPVVALVDRRDVGKPAVGRLRWQCAFERLDRELMMLAADGMAIIAGGGDLEDQWLAPRTGRGVEFLDDFRTGMF